MAKDGVIKEAKDKRSKPDVTRRSFIAKATIGAGAAATLIGSSKISSAASDTVDAARPIKIPDEFAQAAKAPIKKSRLPNGTARETVWGE